MSNDDSKVTELLSQIQVLESNIKEVRDVYNTVIVLNTECFVLYF